MARLFLQVFLVICTCLPLILLVLDMAQRYPPQLSLVDIGLIDGVLLIVALALPLGLLSRLGVDWRRDPGER